MTLVIIKSPIESSRTCWGLLDEDTKKMEARKKKKKERKNRICLWLQDEKNTIAVAKYTDRL